MKQFVLDHLQNACQTATHVVNCRFSSNGADLYVDIASGQSIAVYIVNRAIRVPEIKETLAANTAKKLHTLFLVDGRMMPDEDSTVDPPLWMAALHALASGRVYAYWCDRRQVTIRPVHLEWRWGAQPRAVEYGPAVDLNRLRGSMVETATKYITGYYAIADFGDDAFWKERDPQDGREFKYSWRQWSYGPRRPQTEQPPPPDYDPWETFQRNYGRAEGAARQKSRRQYQQRTGNGSTQRSYAVSSRDYALLGVAATASFEEVKQAYRQKAREYHPDLHPQHDKELYTRKMAAINAAFEAISKRLK